MYTTDMYDEKNMCKTPSGNKIFWMLTSEVGAPNFEMRYIEIPAGAHTSFGSHSHEHEVFVVKGKGRVKGGADEKEIVAGSAVFIPGNEEHQFLNASDTEPLGVICIVPKGAEAESKPPCK